LCRGVISDEDIELIKLAAREKEFVYTGAQSTLRKWNAFEKSLRNELVKIRASRKHFPSHKYMRDPGYVEPFITRAAMSAHRSASLLTSEKLLDQRRWQVLDELSIGHYFDLDFLIIYAYKLLILEKWQKVRKADKEKILEEALQ